MSISDSRFVSFGGEKDYYPETAVEASSSRILVRWLFQEFAFGYLLLSVVFVWIGIFGAVEFLDVETALVVESLADDDFIESNAEADVNGESYDMSIRRKLLLGIASPQRLVYLLIEIIALPLGSISLFVFAFNSYKSVLVTSDIGRRHLSSASGYDVNPSSITKWQWHHAETIMKSTIVLFSLLTIGLIGAAIFTSVTFIDGAASIVCKEKNLCTFVTKTDTR